MNQKAESEYLTIARIRKVRGRRGEVVAEIFTDFPERFRAGAQLLLAGEGPPQLLVIEQSWFHRGQAILKFRGYETIAAAETLVGQWLQIPRSERHRLAPGQVYLSDLIGCRMLEGDKFLGTVRAIQDTGAVPLLEVPSPEGELLVPFAEDICWNVDVENKEIRVRLPEGLQELNRPGTSSPKRKRGIRKPRPESP